MIYTYSRLGTHGALGNQLWQVAGTIGHALKDGQSFQLPDWFFQPYFCISEAEFGPISDGHEIKDFYPDYMQSLDHWFGIPEVIDFLSFSNHAWEKLWGQYDEMLTEHEGLTGVHVRRGNNLKLPDHHPICSLDYFEQAIDSAAKEDKNQLLVFSDDLEWCRKQSLFKDAWFADGNDPSIDVNRLTDGNPLPLESAFLDLMLMAQCDKCIISNSSFSWWGAFLSYSPEVYYPSRWYGKALSHIDTSVMFPSNWVKI